MKVHASGTGGKETLTCIIQPVNEHSREQQIPQLEFHVI